MAIVTNTITYSVIVCPRRNPWRRTKFFMTHPNIGALQRRRQSWPVSFSPQATGSNQAAAPSNVRDGKFRNPSKRVPLSGGLSRSKLEKKRRSEHVIAVQTVLSIAMLPVTRDRRLQIGRDVGRERADACAETLVGQVSCHGDSSENQGIFRHGLALALTNPHIQTHCEFAHFLSSKHRLS